MATDTPMIIKAPAVLLNDSYVIEIGRALRDCREQSGKSAPEVADQLLLSKDQISGLENFNLEKFYGKRQFAQALIKYANFLQHPINPDQITLDGELTAGMLYTNEASNDGEQATKAATGTSTGKWYAYSLASFCIAGLILWAQIDTDTVKGPNHTTQTTLSGTINTSTPKPSLETTAVDNPPAVPITHGADPTAKNDAHIVIQTTSSCWIQLNHTNGNSTQKVYPSNTKLEFARGELSGIIIGNLNAATLQVDNRKIVLAKYQKPDSNVARILGQDGSKLFGN